MKNHLTAICALARCWPSVRNGRVKGFRIEVSGDGKDWTQVAAGELPDTDDGTTVTFESVPVPAKFVRFTALSPRFGGRWASFADLQPQFK